MKKPTVSHEAFISAVRDAAVRYAATQYTVATKGRLLLDATQLKRVARARIVYGRGQHGVRGTTQYEGWKCGQQGDGIELVEVAAASEETWIDLAITTIHELAHCATGRGHGHNKTFKDACHALGFRRPLATYKPGDANSLLAALAPSLREAIYLMPHPSDGTPACGADFTVKTRPCGAGIGTRGGKSRGPGSGSRLRKYTAALGCGQIIRASTDTLNASCNCCGSPFVIS